MPNLDDLNFIKTIDKSDLYVSIEKLPQQISQTWQEINSVPVPSSCPLAKNVVVSGMGGSALGGRIVDSLVYDRFKIPIEIVNDYHLPNYVDQNSLVILSSYSGNTEETLSAAKEAINRGAVIYAITTGGSLAQIIKENNLYGYIFNPVNNPSGQPRMGLGYSITAILAILKLCRFIDVVDSEIEDVVSSTTSFINSFGIKSPANQNQAKQIAALLHNYFPVIVSSGHLNGSAWSFKNQLNENAKTFANNYEVPELNHHLMEGLSFPESLRSLMKVIFLESPIYESEIKKRIEVTKEVLDKNKVSQTSYLLESRQKLPQIFEILALGSFTAYYLALINETDPTPIPWVDYFKEKLASK